MCGRAGSPKARRGAVMSRSATLYQVLKMHQYTRISSGRSLISSTPLNTTHTTSRSTKSSIAETLDTTSRAGKMLDLIGNARPRVCAPIPLCNENHHSASVIECGPPRRSVLLLFLAGLWAAMASLLAKGNAEQFSDRLLTLLSPSPFARLPSIPTTNPRYRTTFFPVRQGSLCILVDLFRVVSNPLPSSIRL